MIPHKYLVDNLHLSDELIGRRFGLTSSAVQKYRNKRGIIKPESARRLMWNDLERDYVKQNRDMPVVLLSFALDRSVWAILNHIKLNKLTQNESRKTI